MSCTQRSSEVMSSFPMRAGRTWCCRWLSGVGVSGWDSGPAQLPALTLAHVSGSQGNQMSIAFMELAYPPPGHVHRRQLQLVEVSRAGLDPSVAQEGPKGVTVLVALHNGKQPRGR